MHTSILSEVSGESYTRQHHSRHSIETFRTYNFWRGTQHFFLEGRIVTGRLPDMIYPLMFLVLLALFTLVFFGILLPEIAPKHYWSVGTVYFVLLSLMLVSYFLTMFTEPGFLPHSNLLKLSQNLNSSNPEAREVLKGLVLPRHGEASIRLELNAVETVELEPRPLPSLRSFDPPTARMSAAFAASVRGGYLDDPRWTEEVLSRGGHVDDLRWVDEALSRGGHIDDPRRINNGSARCGPDSHRFNAMTHHTDPPRLAGTRFCSICRIQSPVTARHCSRCNACVRHFDHHCLLANNCIGLRNFRHFLLLNFFGLLLATLFLGSLIHAASLRRLRLQVDFTLLIILSIQCIFVCIFCMFNLGLYIFLGKSPSEFFEGETSVPQYERPKLLKRFPSLIKFHAPVNTAEQPVLESFGAV